MTSRVGSPPNAPAAVYLPVHLGPLGPGGNETRPDLTVNEFATDGRRLEARSHFCGPTLVSAYRTLRPDRYPDYLAR